MKKFKKIISLILCVVFVGLMSCISVSAETVSIVVESDNIGNIFFEDEAVEFSVSFKGTQSKLKIHYDVYLYDSDMSENKIISEDRIININSEGVLDNIKINVPEYGLYRIDVTALDFDTGEELAKTYTEFSRCVESSIVNSTLGACTHLTTHGDIDDSLYLIKKAGIGNIRDDFRWFMYESYAGKALDPKSSQLIKRAAYYGIDVLAILYGYNGKYENSDYSFVTDDDDLEKFQEFVRSIMETHEFQKYINNVEILNEPDVASLENAPMTDKSEAAQKIRAEAYAKILKKAYDAISEVKPEVTVGAFSTCSVNTVNSRNFVKYTLDYINENNYGQIFDAVTSHIYHGEAYPEVMGLKNNINIFNKPADDCFPGTEKWYTEYGSTTTPTDTGFYAKNSYKQAVKNIRTFINVKENSILDKMYLYSFEDSGVDLSNTQNNYGMVHSIDYNTPYGAKPTYLAVANFNNLAGDATACEEKISTDSCIVEFTCPKRTVYAMYSKAADTTAEIEYDIQNVAAYYDFYGNELSEDEVMTNGKYILTEAPIYAVCGTLPENASNKGFVVSGKIESEEMGREVSLTIVDEKTGFEEITPKNICYIEQQKTTEGGKFRFTVDMGTEESYKAYIVSEDSNTPLGLTLSSKAKEGVEVNLYSGLSKIESADIDISDLAKARAEITFKDYKAEEDFCLYYALYQEGRLVGLSRKEGTTKVGDVTLTYDLSDAEALEFDTIKLMLWKADEGIKPLCDVLTIK